MMFLRGLLAFLLLALALPAWAEEAILSYDSKIVVQEDGVLEVTETIRVRAEGNQIRRGIFRDFPTDYRLPNGTQVNTTFNVLDVQMDGGHVNWVTERISNGTRVRIGSADVFLPTGEYTYTIHFETNRQLYFSDEGFDELYWNVTGNGWDFPINAASATVLIPNNAVIEETRAFTGYQGDTGQAFRTTHLSERQVMFETTGRLNPRQGLTVVVTWPEGFVARPTQADKVTNFFIDNLGILIGYAGFLIIVLYFYFTWREVGRDPDMGPVIARYVPPIGLSPGAVSYVKERAYRSQAFAAAIVNMAVKGYLTINEKSKTKFILKKTGQSARLSEGEKAIADRLFRFEDDIETHHTNHKEFSKAQKAQENVLETSHEGIHFIRNQKPFWIGAGISLVFVLLSFFANAATSGFEVFMLLGMLGFYSIFLFAMRKKAALIRRAGIWSGGIGTFFIIGFLIVHFLGMAGSLILANFFLMIPFVLILITNVVFFNILEKPTLEGAVLLSEIEGFKKYLSIAEKERLEFHTPEITPEKFEEYLPYAIALGVENKWGKAFEAQMQKAGMDVDSYHPSWYHGTRYYGFGSRSFASNFGGAMAGAVVAASAPPSSSGSGGGGFSGGGGGGGGGGGW